MASNTRRPAGARYTGEALAMWAEVSALLRATGYAAQFAPNKPGTVSALSYCVVSWMWSALEHAAAPPSLPNAILLAALLLLPTSRWWMMLVAIVPAHARLDVASEWWLQWAHLGYDEILTLASAAAARLFLAGADPFDGVRQLSLYLGCVILVPVTLAAVAVVVAASPLSASGLSEWVASCARSSLDHVTLTPLIVLWIRRGRQWLLAGHAYPCAVATLVAIGAYVGSAFILPAPLQFVTVCMLVSVALSTAVLLGAAGMVCVVAAIAVSTAVTGLPVAADALAVPPLMLYTLGTAVAVSAFALAVCVDRHRCVVEATEAEAAQLREKLAQLQLALGAGHVGVWNWSIRKDDGRQPSGAGAGPFELLPSYSSATAGIHPEDVARVERCVQQSAELKQDYRCEYRVMLPEGRIRWVEARGKSFYDGAADQVRTTGVVVDVNDREATRRNLRWSEQELQKAKRALAHKSRLAIVGEITAAVIHEINQPLGAILNNAEAAIILLEKGGVPPWQVQAILADIRDDDLRASEIARRTRTLLQDRELTRQVIDLNAVVAEVADLLRLQARRRGVLLEATFGTIPPLHADPVSLQQVLLNLIVNGLDAMERTPPAARRLEIRTVLLSAEWVEIRVSDAGCGIPAGAQLQIFDSFYTSKPDGLGLGLSLARSIIETHGGLIRAENNWPGPGATFRVRLPLGAASANALAALTSCGTVVT